MSAQSIESAISRLKNEFGIKYESALAGAVSFDRPKKRIGLFVYFLVSDGKIVYVGQTADLDSRVEDHTNNKEFDSVVAIPVDGRFINKVEKEFIQLLSPALNRMCNKPREGGGYKALVEWALSVIDAKAKSSGGAL